MAESQAHSRKRRVTEAGCKPAPLAGQFLTTAGHQLTSRRPAAPRAIPPRASNRGGLSFSLCGHALCSQEPQCVPTEHSMGQNNVAITLPSGRSPGTPIRENYPDYREVDERVGANCGPFVRLYLGIGPNVFVGHLKSSVLFYLNSYDRRSSDFVLPATAFLKTSLRLRFRSIQVKEITRPGVFLLLQIRKHALSEKNNTTILQHVYRNVNSG
jgi:hypothetical protein